ncbi:MULTISPECIES: aldose 1-epimerase family protein [unclassified Nocardioides]|uniref:aldose 1-epimerase family protein n=1 Tax=unclassified Nocardioides TaxID=2615069 RepID=UPI00360DD715
MTDRRPSGEQYVIIRGPARAEVTQVGAALRHYSVDGRDVVDGFAPHERAHDGRGQVLAPWPNRLTDGRYRYGDRECQAPLDEPGRHDAIHGLVRWLGWDLVAHDDAAVSLSCTLHPRPGYEWQVDLGVRYELGDDGLTVTFSAVDVDTEPAPFGVGFHPYLAVGGGPVDDTTLHVPAASFLDDAPGRPTPLPVHGTPHDFSLPRRIGDARLDTAYGDLRRDGDGRARARLTGPDGRGVELWVDAAFRYLMVYTADAVGRPDRRRRAVAVEPMTCPPDAFRTGIDLVDLAPGVGWSGSWGLAPADP